VVTERGSWRPCMLDNFPHTHTHTHTLAPPDRAHQTPPPTPPTGSPTTGAPAATPAFTPASTLAATLAATPAATSTATRNPQAKFETHQPSGGDEADACGRHGAMRCGTGQHAPHGCAA
jgi:hypothetical protein